jgi:poly [ADP-ribose] polymerase 6/8
METEHQYMMMMDSPDKAANFKKMRQEYGSYFAYHGSSVENWHSILRKGLVNASNTKLMTTGAAYGEGIYMGNQIVLFINCDST